MLVLVIKTRESLQNGSQIVNNKNMLKGYRLHVNWYRYIIHGISTPAAYKITISDSNTILRSSIESFKRTKSVLNPRKNKKDK